jgi:hypothetical protein
MTFNVEKIKLNKDVTITSLYHSPFDLNLFYLICFAKSGCKLNLILDDIDNIGVDRDGDDKYAYREKYFLSKTGRTNIRSLSFVLPKHLFANLAYPDLKKFDAEHGIKNIKSELLYPDTVEHWIKDVTLKYGVKSLVGPDRAFAYAVIDEDFVVAIENAVFDLKRIISKFSEYSDSGVKFTEWLFSEKPKIGETVASYYHYLLVKIVDRFRLSDSVTIMRMSDPSFSGGHEKLMGYYKTDTMLQNIYQTALTYDGKKDKSDFPFYLVSKVTGQRLIDPQNSLNSDSDYILAPKVLMLNNLKNLVLPYHAVNSNNVLAREVMYSYDQMNCSQIFCDDKWYEHLSSFNLKANLDEEEMEIYGKEEIALSDLNEKIYDKNPALNAYKDWVVGSTMNSLEYSKYPLVFLALLQDRIFYENIPDLYKLTAFK